MATPGYCLAEAYVQRKLHKEALKKLEEERAKAEGFDFEVKQSSGCFPSMLKKVHPGPARSVSEKGQCAGKEVKRLDYNGLFDPFTVKRGLDQDVSLGGHCDIVSGSGVLGRFHNQDGIRFLYLSFTDSGKATAKTTKANVRNGACKWADPIYETTRLLQDNKTKQYDEKLYKLVVAMGSTRSTILGEATINLADYTDALKPSVIALPLHGCDSGSILHVTVQLLTSKTGFREFEQQRERGLQTDQNSPDESSGRKVNTRVRFKEKSKDLASLEEEVGPNEEYADSAVGFDGSSNTSESLYAEKHETSSTHEIDSIRMQGTNDWVHGWSSDYSVDNDLAAAYEDNIRLRGSLEVAESSIHELKLEVNSIQSHADNIGHEAQKFAKQLDAEIASGKELVKEVSVLKSECSKLKGDLEQLKVSKLCPPFSSREVFGAEQNRLFQDLQLRWLKGLLAMEDKIREFQNKECFGNDERDFRFLSSDIEALLGILQNLKQASGLSASSLNLLPSEGASIKEIREMSLHKNGQFATGEGFDVDLYQPELGMLHCLNIPGLISHESDAVDTINAMRSKIFELLRELDESKADRESLAKKMDQMECYYEALVQELEENQSRILHELQNIRNEHSTCLYTVSSTKAEMESMRQDLNDQIVRLANDKSDIDSLNKELEGRAVTAEAALKRARLNYSIAVDQLQKDLELLSLQVLSMYETNENLIRQAFVDSSQPSIQEFDSREYAAKLLQFQNQAVGIRKQQLGGDSLDDLKRSLHLQEGLYQKVEEEVFEMHFVNIYLDVLSRALQETLLGANEDVKLMNEKANELKEKLELSAESKVLLMQKLQIALDDVHSLNDYKANCIAKCNDVTQQNRNLEVNLQNVTCENHCLVQKITEWEAQVMQYRGYESKYEACSAEKAELVCLLEKKTLENGILQQENLSLQDELKIVKIEFGEQASQKENAESGRLFAIQDLQSRDLTGVLMQLEELQYNACERILQLVEEKKCLMHEMDVAQLSTTAAESEIALMKQKFEHEIRSMVDKLDVSNALLQKLQLDIDIFADRLEDKTDESSKLVSELSSLKESLQSLHDEKQTLIASLQNKIKESANLALELNHLKETLQSLDDEKQSLMASSQEKTKETAKLTSELNSLKENLQTLHDENQVLMVCSREKSEESSKLKLELNSLKECLQSVHNENQALVVSSQDKTNECVQLASELNRLGESLRSLYDQLQEERRVRESLEIKITNQTSQLNEKEFQLLHLKKLVSDLELEKLRVCNLLSHYDDSLKSIREECCSLSGLETEICEVHELLIAADVKLIFTRTQYEDRVEELVLQLCSSDRQVTELLKKHIDLETTLTHCLANEAQYIEENANLLTSLNSIRSEIEASIAENSLLLEANRVTTAELEEYKHWAHNVVLRDFEGKSQQCQDVERLKHTMLSFEEETDNLMFSKEEMEVQVLVLKAKLDEQQAHIIAMEGMELKDKADAECIQAREKREPEVPPVAMQESLRIAFIKEQYETRLQELKLQLSISKKHSEEMLWKLQDAIDEIENRKKSEACHLKKNEELGMEILKLESELQSVFLTSVKE
ncbi:hypothetical protein GH714_024552 [Hevea brasiliensis]|uniref:C2 NT-type domain-containing protein n=1 Tax=Hevea brasiliensis TaxID=3981 RepID=A0A6A6KTV0_HEVBR|nr:hypothetical protein GH714_024552 [Hevea brasiliensis]